MMEADFSVLHLRPHHLLCLQTFVGRGYSEEFVSQMTLVKKSLTSNPTLTIELTDGADDLCCHCPNCVDGVCTSDKPPLFDRLTAEKLTTLLGSRTEENRSDSNGCSASEKASTRAKCPRTLDVSSTRLQGIPQTLDASPTRLQGIPQALHISESLLRDCCPGCEWKELCLKVIHHQSTFRQS